ncbi:MAG: ABC transporter permease [Candidatus Acidiferrales bacterium]
MLSDLLIRVRALMRRDVVEQELDEELRFHFEEQVEKFMKEGVPRDEARRRARLEFGGAELIKEECREARGVNFVETLAQDVRYALRTLRKSPGFAAVAVLTLALGIGANTAIFSVVEGVVLAPLPYAGGDRLVMVWESNPRFVKVWTSYLNFRDWQRTARSFQQMTAFSTWQGYDLTNPGTPEHLDGKQVTAGFFSTLGTQLARGRDFTSQEDGHGGAPAVIISDRLWRDRLGGSDQALGKSVVLNGVDYAIVGIAPPGFRIEGDADVYVPLGQGDPVILNNRGSHEFFSIARLKPGVNISEARAEMSTIQSNLDQLYPEANRDVGADVGPLKREMVGDVSGTLLMLLGAVGLVLLIACANVANLLLARAAGRTREFAIRSALGANRGRVVRQLLTESLLLSLAGGALGMLAAVFGVSPVLAAVPESLPRSENIGVNGPVLLFTFSASIAVGILFGLAPALKSWNADLQSSLKEGGRGSTRAHHRAQSSLVIIQLALALVLLVGAGLLFRTIRQMWDVNPGFDAPHIITFKVGVSRALTKTASSTRIAYQQLIERIRKIPGVQAADFAEPVPLSGESGTMPFWIGPQKPASIQAAPRLVMFLTGPDYLGAMGIPLLRGRFFSQEDTTKSPCVMVIDSVFADIYFPGRDPVGETLSAGFAPVGPCQIVGVVGHVKNWGLDDSGAYTRTQAYFPLYQDPDEWVAANYPDTSVIVHTPLEPASLVPEIRRTVEATGADQPVYRVQTMREIVSQSMASQRFPMILLSVFAGLALLLASVGVYGVISYSVTQRVHEIGIRMALGAQKQDVFRMTIGHGLKLALAGLAVGVPAALILTRALTSFSHLLYGVRGSDAVTFIVVSSVLSGVAILACYIPARRAAKVDPMVALRHE